MNTETIREYCIAKKGVTESFPFDNTTLVFKVMNKMFALLSLDEDLRVSLKCDPEKAIELRELYSFVIPGYHLNKKLWNTININTSVSDRLICEWIDHSYDLIVASLTKKLKEELKNK
ncbi:MAG: MmcQ/YjbR family DNA-binding protein [Prolixibacteraceae bacterium]|jgi:predicted DNA-binding protein (MmcQ/YjbR family)|nr:MmcQ/YjbR family DNA-binding protein [Prolixibacteraceae bacterium]